MYKRVIKFELSEQEISRAIKELMRYKSDFLKRVDRFRLIVAERLADEVKQGFTGAVADDLIKGTQKMANVDVSVINDNDISIIVANGEDALWVEFGTGVYHNGSLGTSPHPNGTEVGMLIGGFGKGNGKKEIWGFYDNGELRLTRGTPSPMPMYRAMQNICDNIQNIAREVFG